MKAGSGSDAFPTRPSNPVDVSEKRPYLNWAKI